MGNSPSLDNDDGSDENGQQNVSTSLLMQQQQQQRNRQQQRRRRRRSSSVPRRQILPSSSSSYSTSSSPSPPQQPQEQQGGLGGLTGSMSTKNLTRRQLRRLSGLSREQLRAKSFLAKQDEATRADLIKKFLQNDGKENGDSFDWNDNDDDDNGNVNDEAAATMNTTTNKKTKEYIQRLQSNISLLSDKCAALESQNILVAVQQLDILAQTLSMILTGLVLYLYWKFIVLGLTTTSPSSSSSSLLYLFTETTTKVLHWMWQTCLSETVQLHLIEQVSLFQSMVDAVTESVIAAVAVNIPTTPSDIVMLLSSSLSMVSSYMPSTTAAMLLLVRSILLVIPYFYNKWTHGSMHRRNQVFVIFFIIVFRVRMCRWRERMFLQEDAVPSSTGGGDGDDEYYENNIQVARFGEACTNEGIWEANYEISARFLYLSIVRLRGLWTKTAQYMSSRADFMPVSYIRELSKLQDQAPATSWDDIVKNKLLPKRLLQDVDLTDMATTRVPIASASIGQVHLAKLKSTGEKIVIKVQHPHARTLMMDDFWSLQVLMKIMGWMEPEYAFMEILMREWATEARKELDFQNEALHLRQANDALTKLFPTKDTVIYAKGEEEDEESSTIKMIKEIMSGNGTKNNNDDTTEDNQEDKSTNTTTMIPFQVEIPRPMEHLSNQKVLVMTYCEGCRIDNFNQLNAWNLSRTAVMDGLSQTFAHFMYCSPIFNGDPHPGNLLVRPGISTTAADIDDKKKDKNDKDYNNNKVKNKTKEGFTLVILDWGLAKKLPEMKRIAFCQMVYAASTLDYGLLLDSYKTVGLRMKREDSGQSMEDMRFFLRDMAPKEKSRKFIKSKLSADSKRRAAKKEKVPMESKAYPGEFFFFIRVNELLHGLGGRYGINLGYMEALKPYAERGLRESTMYGADKKTIDALRQEKAEPPKVSDPELQAKLQTVLEELEKEDKLVGGQICILNKDGSTMADVVRGNLGGLKSHIPMPRQSLVLGYSTTKAVTATVAHCMVEAGYLTYDEPICERVWKAFCPTEQPPKELRDALRRINSRKENEENDDDDDDDDDDDTLTWDEIVKRWNWKRRITLRHVLNHTSGLWSALPHKLTMKRMASCETCLAGYEYPPPTWSYRNVDGDINDDDLLAATLLPTSEPGEKFEYHFISFGWLVAGIVCGAYDAAKHTKSDDTEHHSKNNNNNNKVTYEQVYNAILAPKLSTTTKESGFCPLGGSGDGGRHILAQTATNDVRASQIIQKRREMSYANAGDRQKKKKKKKKEKYSTTTAADGADGGAAAKMNNDPAKSILKTFAGKEFLLDPRIWNSRDSLNGNVPAAGGRFSARGLAQFYNDLGSGRIVSLSILDKAFEYATATEKTITTNKNTKMSSSSSSSSESPGNMLQGVTRITSAVNNSTDGNTKVSFGYQLIQTELDGRQQQQQQQSTSTNNNDTSTTATTTRVVFSGIGHAGVGGSIGFVHRPTGICIGLMLNKADGGSDTTTTILRAVANHIGI